MASLRDRLIALIEPLLTQLGYELVELEYAPARGGAVLRIFIDRPQGQHVDPGADAGSGEHEPRAQGIGISDCEKVSREVSALLDVEDPIPTAYQLEVSSPGDDRVLRTPAHFERFAGARVLVELAVPRDGRRRYTGTLAAVDPAGIALEVDGTRVQVRYTELEKARLAPLIEARPRGK